MKGCEPVLTKTRFLSLLGTFPQSPPPYEFGKSEPAGVAGDPELACGKELAEKGYIVICPDRFPFESRMLSKSNYANTFDLFRIVGQGSDIHGDDFTEDLYQGAYSNKLAFEGRTLTGKTLHELQRAVDVLQSLPYVDPERIGVIGHSAGGFYAALLMYIDQQIQAGCSSCGTFKLEFLYGNNQLRPINGFGGCLIPGLKPLGDVDDILAQLVPRPFLETRGDADTDSEWFMETHRKAKARYNELGRSERYKTVPYGSDPVFEHIFRKDMREKSYAWLDQWLNI